MTKYYCQAVDIDEEDYWAVVKAYDEEGAATKYAEICDNNSGGELFLNPLKDKLEVRVKTGADVLMFTIMAKYSKEYYTL